MPCITYVKKRFSAGTKAMIDAANTIIAEYAAQGFDLTLRQLYYQFVARDLLKNSQQEYKRLGSIINDARLAGLIDWDRITDRTRNLKINSHWSSPADIMNAAAQSFRHDKWADQPHRPEVWIEKDALLGVLDAICPELDVPYFSCRGYTSQSEMWVAAQRLKRYARRKQTPVIIHLGDHDPSGLDMTRDITDRLALFMGGVEVRRIALNMDQVEEHEPPPNPAKTTDARAANYIAEYGNESWELDALDPATLSALIRETVEALRDDEKWDAAVEREEEAKRLLGKAAVSWDAIAEGLANGDE
jgi:hypothetical protein